MHSALTRANALAAYTMSVLASLTFLCFLSTFFIEYQVHAGIDTVKVVVKNVPDYAAGKEKNDLGFLTFDLQADLNPLFNWNVKQIFLYLTAEYETKANKLNQVVLWDKIILRGENALLDYRSMNTKYYFWDDGNGLLNHQGKETSNGASKFIIYVIFVQNYKQCGFLHSFNFINLFQCQPTVPNWDKFRELLKEGNKGEKSKRKTCTPLLISEEEEQRAHGAEEKDREESEGETDEGAEEKRKRQERKKECEHREGPPEENPDQGHPDGEADPRAEAPSTEDKGPQTSPMHTRAGTYMDKPAKQKGKKRAQ